MKQAERIERERLGLGGGGSKEGDLKFSPAGRRSSSTTDDPLGPGNHATHRVQGLVLRFQVSHAVLNQGLKEPGRAQGIVEPVTWMFDITKNNLIEDS